MTSLKKALKRFKKQPECQLLKELLVINSTKMVLDTPFNKKKKRQIEIGTTSTV